MPPHRGQGLNHAIQDAYNFVQLQTQILNDPSIDQAQHVQSYSDEVAKRGAEEVTLSRQNAYMMLAYSDMKNSPYFTMGLKRS